jgi:hypothetical protein
VDRADPGAQRPYPAVLREHHGLRLIDALQHVVRPRIPHLPGAGGSIIQQDRNGVGQILRCAAPVQKAAQLRQATTGMEGLEQGIDGQRPYMVAPPSLFTLPSAASASFLIHKGFQDIADHVQLAPTQLLALRPIDNDVPDMHGGRGSPSAAPHRRGLLRTLCIRHTSHHPASAAVVRHASRNRGKRQPMTVSFAATLAGWVAVKTTHGGSGTSRDRPSTATTARMRRSAPC